MNILIVVDMQNDFVSGALGTPEARRIVPAVAERVATGIRRGSGFSSPGTPMGRTISIPGRGGTCLYPTASGDRGLGDRRAAPACQRRTGHSGQALLRQRGAGASAGGGE